MSCLILIIGFTAIFFTAQSVIALQVAEILCGIVRDILLYLVLYETDIVQSHGACSKRVSPFIIYEHTEPYYHKLK